MRSLLSYTPAEKRGMVDGIGLFFGALIGTNLGSFDALGRTEYTTLIVLLVGTVMSLRIFSTTERRWHGYLLLSLYSVIIFQVLFVSKLTKGIPVDDRDRLAITLALWFATVIVAELTPIKDLPAKDAPAGTDT